MVKITDAEFKRAEARGSRLLVTELRANTVSYDRVTGRIVIELSNGCAYSFPAQAVQDLQGAAAGDIASVEIDGAGFNLHWPKLDVDLYVPSVVAGIFGTRAWMVRELARHAGQTKSTAKAIAARTNGAKGGRPRKAAAG